MARTRAAVYAAVQWGECSIGHGSGQQGDGSFERLVTTARIGRESAGDGLRNHDGRMLLEGPYRVRSNAKRQHGNTHGSWVAPSDAPGTSGPGCPLRAAWCGSHSAMPYVPRLPIRRTSPGLQRSTAPRRGRALRVSRSPEVPSNALRAMRPHATAVTRGVRARTPVPGRDVERHPALQRRHPGALMHATIGERCWWGAEDHGEHHTLLHASWRHHVQRSPALSPCGARHSGFGHGCVPRRMSDRRHRGRVPPKVSGLTASRPG